MFLCVFVNHSHHIVQDCLEFTEVNLFCICSHNLVCKNNFPVVGVCVHVFVWIEKLAIDGGLKSGAVEEILNLCSSRSRLQGRWHDVKIARHVDEWLLTYR